MEQSMCFLFFLCNMGAITGDISLKEEIYFCLFFSSTEQTKSPRVPDLQQQRQQQQWKQQDTFKRTKMYMHTHVITKHLRE